MKKYFILLILANTLLNSCNKDKFFNGPNFYQDNFENYSNLNDLLIPDNQLWSFAQLTRNENQITIDNTKMHSGNKSLKFVAKKSEEGIVSKCSISKQKMSFKEGETIRMSIWYYIESNNTLNWLFLLDLEEQAAIGAGPGMRLALVDNKLRIEHKFNEKDVIQTPGKEVEFPRNQWVEIIWEVKLSQKNKGTIKLWQNGQLIIDSKNNRTLPKDLLYFQQGTKGIYSSCEIGITANSKDSDLTIWADDIKFEKVN